MNIGLSSQPRIQETLETVTAVRESIELRATIIVISSGGELAGLAEMNDKVHLITVPLDNLQERPSVTVFSTTRFV